MVHRVGRRTTAELEAILAADLLEPAAGFMWNSLRSFIDLRWLWLLAPGVAVFASLRSFLVLQLLSAILLFALLFVMLAVLIAVFVALVVGFDHVFQWTLVALASLTRPSYNAAAKFGYCSGIHRSSLTRTLKTAREPKNFDAGEDFNLDHS